MPEGISDFGVDGGRLGFGAFGTRVGSRGTSLLGAVAEGELEASGVPMGRSEAESGWEKVVGAGATAVMTGMLPALSTVTLRLGQLLAIAPRNKKTRTPPNAPTV